MLADDEHVLKPACCACGEQQLPQGTIPSSWSQSPGLRVLFLSLSKFTGNGQKQISCRQYALLGHACMPSYPQYHRSSDMFDCRHHTKLDSQQQYQHLISERQPLPGGNASSQEQSVRFLPC